MNLLALTSALLISGANVLNAPIKEHSNNKMIDVEEKYQTNEVNDLHDLVIGNLYHFHAENVGFDELTSFGNLHWFGLNFINVNYYDFSNYAIVIDEVIGNSYIPNGSITFILDVYTSSTAFTFYLTFNDDNDSFATFNTAPLDDSPFTLDGDFIFNGLDVGDDFGYQNDFNFISRSNYNVLVPSTSHRGNLYTTIYDFFYGLFDTSDTNELSMEIMGQNLSLTSWLAHTVTIILLLLGVIWLIFVIRWIFRVFSGLIHV